MKYKEHKQFRLRGFDYALAGYYFVTICTHNRTNYFGEILIDDGGMTSMALSPIGKIILACWRKIPEWYDYVKLDIFQIMPNHLHGIIVITNDGVSRGGSCRNVAESANSPILLRSYNDRYDDNSSSEYFSAISPQSGSLGAIIRSFKSRAVKECKNQGLNFIWQPRFHDHIIRNEQELNNIRHYVQTNVINWQEDRNNLPK